ncbi:MAG: DUF58 domain-containing protein [Lachnospiraceae bacterium]|nr:DUF58 domain-containing protein [Lachnospiraceae bacterium]
MTRVQKSFLYIIWLIAAAMLFFFECSEYTATIFITSICAFPFLLTHKKKDEEKTVNIIVTDQSIKNDPSEAYGIREYVPGDSIKSIHWKLSEKTGKTMVREYGMPVPQPEVRLIAQTKKEAKKTYNALKKTVFGRVMDIILPIAFFVTEVLLLLVLADLKVNIIPILIGTAVLTVLMLLKGRKKLLVALGTVTAAVGSMIIVPSVREGFRLFVNGLMYNSEKLNRYRYLYFEIKTPGQKATAITIAFIVSLALVLAAAISIRNAFADTAIGLIMFFIMSYFGIGGREFISLLFGLVASGNIFYHFIRNEDEELIKKYRTTYISAVAICVAAAIISVISFGSFAKGICEKVDSVSEYVRDIIEQTDRNEIENIVSKENRDEYYKVKQESTYNDQMEQNANNGSATEYNKEIYEENMISMPEYRTNGDVIKGILMGIMALLVLIVPFIPFFVLEKVKNKIRKQRELYESEEHRTAVRAMFPQLMNYVAILFNIKENNYEVMTNMAKEYMPDADLPGLYNIWLETEYSDNDIVEEKRKKVSTVFFGIEDELSRNTGYFKRLKYGILR